jgi:4-hydroxyacetophenone monooxygenase
MTDRAVAGGLDSIEPPLKASDDEIAKAVAEAGLLPLAMSCVHMSGRMDVAHALGVTRPPQFSGDTSGALSSEQIATVQTLIVDTIIKWRDAGCRRAYRPSSAEVRQMVDLLAGKALSPRYTALLTEELGFEGDARAFGWARAQSAERKAAHPVLIIGAGLAGIVMGYRLLQAGIPFTIIDKNGGPGGTWFENRYPGARVDVPSHCYSFSFLRRQRWPELFSPAPVLREYFADCVQELGLARHVRYQVEALSAHYDDSRREWEVVLRPKDGAEERLRVRSVISAVGQLNRPLIPQIPGQQRYRGLRLHTSRWPSDLDVAGKRIAVVGTAATALQLIPELAKSAAKLIVFQRSPTWVFVHPEYRRAIRPGEQWAMDHLPGYADWYRVLLYNWANDGSAEALRIDPGWTQPGSVSAANEAYRTRLTKSMMEAMEHDPALAARVMPTFPPGVKRPNLGDGGYFRALRQSNVELVTEGLAEFASHAVIDGAGREHPVDVVVYATGFRALEYLAPMRITGRGGENLTSFWADEPGAYLGITVPKFPNLYLMYGPGTNLGYNGNLFFNAECQARYISGCLRWMLEDGLDAIEVKPGVYTQYVQRMQQALAQFTWSHPSAGSWYKNKAGKVIANSPWPLIDYWDWTRSPNPQDFDVSAAR